ncbi:MAG TPA: cation:proton antiporter [Xanthobacteraceae bacterium]|jgi:CPA2 family monovalent cation:H+ antiporter-2|nr:cation:proton antiporter [Xanthobacteraceae bacterium]
MSEGLLLKALIILFISASVVGALARLKLPSPIGYLVSGLLIGPYGLQLLTTSAEIDFLSNLGIVFLMFIVGLELSIPATSGPRRNFLLGGSLQVGLTALLIFAGAILYGSSPIDAILLGGAGALSSVIIVMKQLANQNEISREHGQIALNILTFQSMTLIPFVAIIGAFEQAGGFDPVTLLRHVLIATAAFLLVLALCRLALRPTLTFIAQRNLTDLFLPLVLLFAMTTAVATHFAQLAPPISAYLSGMTGGESDAEHRIENSFRPFRDTMLGLFFLAMGMKIDPSVIQTFPQSVLEWTSALIVGKTVVLLFVGAMMHWPPIVAARVAVILSHGGGLSLLLLTEGMRTNAIPPDAGQPALMAVAITMLLGSILIRENRSVAKIIDRQSSRLK